MSDIKKLIVAGVGGQGVTYTVRLLMSAAVLADITVNTDEIHGLSQRGGVVNAGLTFGDAGHGFVDAGQADFLIGLEKLEAQRCVKFLHPGSRLVIDNTELTPFTVNAGMSEYPDTEKFINRLRENVAEVIYVEEGITVSPKFRNYYLLGMMSTLQDFPVDSQYMVKAIEQEARKNTVEESVKTFHLGRQYR